MPTSSPSLISLESQKYISLTTFRRTGAAVATPVWFVLLHHTLYLYTVASAGKVKRIRNNPQVQLAVCTKLGKVKGPLLAGRAHIVTDPQEQARLKPPSFKKRGVPVAHPPFPASPEGETGSWWR